MTAGGFAFAHPAVLAGVPAAFALVVLGLRAARHREASRLRARLSAGVRFLALALVLVALAGPERDGTVAEPGAGVLLADRSASIPASGVRRERELLGRLREEGPARVIPFGGPDASDARPALLRAAVGRAERLALVTDGRLDGDAALLLADLARAGVATGVLAAGPAGGPPAAAPGPVRVEIPPGVRRGTPFEVRVHAPGAATVTLRADGARVAEADAEDGLARFPGLTLAPGRHELVAVATGPGGRGAGLGEVDVPGPLPVLVLGAGPKDPVPSALAAQGIDVRTAPAAGGEIGDARVVVALPGAHLDRAGPGLAGFVTHGGGLLAATGPAPGLADLAGKPVADLLPATAKPAPPEAAPPPPTPPPRDEKPPEGASPAKTDKDAYTISLLLVMDRSGSMAGPKIELARAACYEAARALDPKDRLGILAFNHEFEWIRRFAPAGDLAAVASSLRRLTAGGGTEIFPAMQEAFRAMKEEKSGIRHVVLFSDGQDVLTGFRKLLDEMRAARITVSAVGVGTDYEVRFLSSIAEWGAGRFYDATDPRELPRVVTLDAKRVIENRPPRPEPPGKDLTAGAPKGGEKPEPDRPPEPPANPPVEVRAAPIPVLEGLTFPRLPAVEPVAPRFPARTALATAGGAPVLTLWRVGAGRVAHFAATPDAWATWPDFGRFLAQLVRLLAGSPPAAAGPAPELRIAGRRVTVRTAEDEPPVLRLEAGGRDRPLPAARSGPGEFSADLPPAPAGTLQIVRAETKQGGRAAAIAVAPTPPERSAAGTDPDEIARLSRAAGRPPDELPPPPAVRRRPGRKPLHLPLLVAAVLLLPLDVAVRRLGR